MNPTVRAWVELVRGPAALTVPGDLLAGAAAAGGGTVRRTGPVIGASLCLYWAGMALNDWADRHVDAAERPGRPIPSGRIRPGAALAAATALTGAGLGLAAATGSRRTLSTAAALTGAVWGYDLWLKNTPAGPAAMASARGLNLLLGAAATGRPMGPAARPAALLAAHTLALTSISRHEVHGGPRTTPATALLTTAAIAGSTARPAEGWRARLRARSARPAGAAPVAAPRRPAERGAPATRVALAASVASYLATVAPPLVHAVREPTGARMRAGVVGGLQGLLPLQATLAARAGASRLAPPALLLALGAARRLSRKVTPT